MGVGVRLYGCKVRWVYDSISAKVQSVFGIIYHYLKLERQAPAIL